MKKRVLYFLIVLFPFLLVSSIVKAQSGTKITQTTLVEVKLNSVFHINCHGDKKGAINIMVSGGIPPYSYQWSNGATTQDIAGLGAGKYTVIVKDTYGCPDTLTVEVKEPPKLSVKVDSVNDILCYGFKNGRIDVSVKGGVPPYIYNWSDESTKEDLINVEAGEYALLVTDAKNCQEIASATIVQNPLIVKSNEKVQNVNCSGDSTGVIDIKVNGGIPPYSYRWTSGEMTQDLKHLVAGDYTVMVSDSRGCTEAYSTKVFEPNPIVVEVEDVSDISCAGDRSGSININVTGGVKPYKYRWNDSLAFTQDLAGLAAGEYNLVVEDSRSCKKTITEAIKEPEKIIVKVDNVKDVLNYGGSDGAVYISVTGGVTPYNYTWSNGLKSEDIANLPANNYTCRIVDKNKCVNTISVNIKQPALLEAEVVEFENIKCFGEQNGFINVAVKGGVPPYSYKWSNGETEKNIKNLKAGTYSLLVTDANGIKKTVKATISQPTLLTSNLQSTSNIACYGRKEGIIDINVKGGTPPYTYNWSNGSKTQDLAAIPAGEYFVKIRDKNQCLDSLSAEVKQSSKLEVVSKEVEDIKCYGKAEGSIGVSVNGGTAPYIFNWSNGAKTQNLSKLVAGQYNLKVTDAKGCDEALDVRIKEPTLLVSSISEVVNVKCKGDSTGAVKIAVSGGTAPYTYKWSNEVGTKDNTFIKAGGYSVNIIDANGCTNTLSATVEEPAKLYSTLDKQINIDCFNESTGAIDVNVGGGVPPYDYKWNNGAATQNLIGIKSGDYTLIVTDQNRCTSELKTTVKQNSDLVSTVEDIVHVLCNGDKTGSAKVKVEGGVTPYAFKWSNGSTLQNLDKVKADNYSLVITDAKGCVENASVLIKQPAEFGGEIVNIKQIGCHGESNGEITTAFKGGVSPYSYKWNTEQTTKDLKGLVAGSYSVTATDNNGCTKVLKTDIEQPTKLELKLLSVVDNLCAGERNGAIDISVIGGVAPYTYKWNNGGTTQDQSGLIAGEYKVHVTGATGCLKSLDAVIKEPQPLSLKVSSTKDVLCNGGNNGAIDLAVSGGTEPYVYSWSNGAKTQDIKEIVAGSYTVNVMDAHGCNSNISANIKQPEPLEVAIADVKHILCYGDSTGAISIDVKGGVQPYSYKWSNGMVTEDIKGLKVGTYSVDIVDANGCSQSLKATIEQPNQMISKVVATKDVLCNGVKEGSIDISVIGGVTPYLYTWSNGNKLQDIENAPAGQYTVDIKDANGCAQSLSAVIKEPSMMVVSLSQITDIKEFGKKNGSISITVNGGTNPYTYSWSNGAVTQNIENLVAGDYSVIVLDKNGCRQDLNAKITQPDAIVANIDTIDHIKCYGEKTGFVKVSAKGGVPPYSFTWDNGWTGNMLNSVPAGKYLLTITDVNGAKIEENIEIEQPEYFNVKISDAINPTCFEQNNGIVKTDVKGGTTPYTFVWNNGANSQDLKGLNEGRYSVTVTDAKGCSQIDSTELVKPTQLVARLINKVDIECFGEHKGEINIAVEGGISPYNYNWSHGSKEQNLTDLIAGNYSVKVTDKNGCQKSLNTTINQPTQLVSRLATVKDVPCFGENKGLISTSVTGGTPPYDYKWNTGDSTGSISNLIIGSYAVTITDSHNCKNELSSKITQPTELSGYVSNVNDINCFGDKEGSVSISVKGGTPPYKYFWSNGGSDQNLTKIPAGNYNVKITDNNGCVKTLDAVVKEPTQLVAKVGKVTNILCFGDKTGSVNVNVSGGVEPYSYSWSNGSVSQDLTNIPAGNYALKIQDSKGCVTNINANVEEPLPLVVENVSTGNIKCSGGNEGEVTISVKGGVTPYVFNWNNGMTTKDLSNIPAGNYDLKVSDANGCIKTTDAQIVQPPELKKSIDAVTHISCTGESNGSVNISVSGGTVPYSYQWSNGNTTQDLVNVKAGKYSVIITEGNGCTSSLDVTITEPSPFAVKLQDVKHNNCYGDENGAITISTEGGTTPYIFRWNNGEKTQNLENKSAGDYSVLVSDANGCNHTIKTTIEQPDELVLTVDSARNVKCCGDTSGAIFISVKGGEGPYKYLWSHGATSQDVTGLVEGQYTVTVTDARGCTINTPEEGATIYEKIIAQGKFISRDILFDVGKASIKERSFVEISRIASFMKEHPEIRFSIEGHTDSQGDANANIVLSRKRAKAIKESLVKFGINENRLETEGYGESKPVDTNATVEGRANNRRVEFIPL